MSELEITQRYLRVKGAILQNSQELYSQSLDAAVKEGSLAAGLHAYYNQVGLKEGWLKPEYATPLYKQNLVNQQKNMLAAADVITYWSLQFRRIEWALNRPYSGSLAHAIMGEALMEFEAQRDLVDEMIKAVDYLDNNSRPHVNFGADSQHEQWKKFVSAYQKDRINPQSPNFREENYRQFNALFGNLSEKEKNQDRLILAVLTDMILANADIEYQRKITFH